MQNAMAYAAFDSDDGSSRIHDQLGQIIRLVAKLYMSCIATRKVLTHNKYKSSRVFFNIAALGLPY